MTDLLNVKETVVNDELVERLERLLRQAKAGEIQGFAYVVSWDYGKASNGWITPFHKDNSSAFVGEMTLLLQDLSFHCNIETADSATNQKLGN